MNLFVNTISTNANLIIFNNNKEILNTLEFEIKWNESSLLIPKIDLFLKENNLEYKELENIVCVNWPWSFTWVRTTVLAINSINYIINNNITPVSFFDLYNNYPIVKSSSKRDCFVKLNNESKIEIIENSKIEEYLKEKNIKTIYWNCNLDNVEIIEKIDYISIIKMIEFKKFKKIDPLYIKKPNIC
jgi:tRNA A37 threonylcarbamoyladenosine modification protein TsaB